MSDVLEGDITAGAEREASSFSSSSPPYITSYWHQSLFILPSLPSLSIPDSFFCLSLSTTTTYTLYFIFFFFFFISACPLSSLVWSSAVLSISDSSHCFTNTLLLRTLVHTEVMCKSICEECRQLWIFINVNRCVTYLNLSVFAFVSAFYFAQNSFLFSIQNETYFCTVYIVPGLQFQKSELILNDI